MTKILIIDDNDDNQLIFKSILESIRPDTVVLSTLTSKEGLMQARALQPDIILLDVIMPEIDGYEVCRRLRSNPDTQSIPVIMITALEIDPATKVKMLETGADAFLEKPVNQAELDALITATLKKKKINDSLRAEKESLEELLYNSAAELHVEKKEGKRLEEPLPGGDEHILFVDDDTELVKVGCDLLEELGYKVTGLTNSLEALCYFRSNHDSVDLVISDLNMPNMTGPELAAEIHRAYPKTPFILTSGFSENLKQEKSKHSGILKTLNKPLIMSELAVIVREALAHNS